MSKPAVSLRNETAGKMTKQFLRTVLTWSAAAVMAGAFMVTPALAELKPPQRVTKTITTVEPVPFGISYIELPTVYKGYSELVSKGAMGEREIETQVLFEGDKPMKILSVKAVETAQPIDQVIKRGAKVVRSETVNGKRWEKSFLAPLQTGWLSADFYDYPHHNGIDLAAPYGTAVSAAAGGKVVLAGWYGEYGRCVIIEHADASRTLYGHNSSLLVSVGETVKQGQQISKVGSTGNSTGNHLHFELRVGERMLDPLIYLDQ